MSKKDDIISIDLDEEQEKRKKQKEEEKKIEITAGDLFIRVPANRGRIEEAIRVLDSFLYKIDERSIRQEEEKPRPLREQIEKDIKETKQVIKDAEEKEKEIAEKMEEPIREDETVLNEGKRYAKCPVCNGKIKKKKIQQFDDGLVQVVKCKNRKCGWTHTYKVEI